MTDIDLGTATPSPSGPTGEAPQAPTVAASGPAGPRPRHRAESPAGLDRAQLPGLSGLVEWARSGASTQKPATVGADPSSPGPGPDPSSSGPSGLDGPPGVPTSPELRPGRKPGPEARPPAEPNWLRWSIILGLAALTAAGLILVFDGQVRAAYGAQVRDGRQYLAPFVMEAVALLWTLLGYRRGRHGGSPLPYWLLSAATGAYAVYVITRHTPTTGAALLFGGASVAAQLLTFVKFYEDLRRWRTEVLHQTAQSRAKFGVLWLTRPRLARRAWLLAVEHGITARDQAVAQAHLWMPVFSDTREWLRHPEPSEETPEPATVGRWRARSLARRVADRSVAENLGKPVARLPRRVRLAQVAVTTKPSPEPLEAPSPPSPPGPTGPAQAQRALSAGPGPQAWTQAQPTSAPPSPAPSSPQPGPGPDSGPEPEARPGAPRLDTLIDLVRGRFTDDELDFYRNDLITLGRAGDWLTDEKCPTKEEIKNWCSRGSTHAGKIRQIVEAVRTAHSAAAHN